MRVQVLSLEICMIIIRECFPHLLFCLCYLQRVESFLSLIGGGRLVRNRLRLPSKWLLIITKKPMINLIFKNHPIGPLERHSTRTLDMESLLIKVCELLFILFIIYIYLYNSSLYLCHRCLIIILILISIFL